MRTVQVTTGAEAKEPREEKAGIVNSDSLAAESISAGGAFATKNPSAGVFPQSSKGSTANNADISAARELPPATNSAVREGGGEGEGFKRETRSRTAKKTSKESGEDTVTGKESRKGTEKEAEKGAEQGPRKDTGDDSKSEVIGTKRGDGEGSKSGSSDKSKGTPQKGQDHDDDKSNVNKVVPEESKISGDDDTSKAGKHGEIGAEPAHRSGSPAPTYVRAERARNPGEYKPHGKNLGKAEFKEGDEDRNTSFTAEIGSKDDPGRASLVGIQRINASTDTPDSGTGAAAGAAAGARGDNVYSALKESAD